MRDLFSKILFLATSIFYLFHFLFFSLYETTDSYFYWAFADFMKTGKYFTPHPYYWIIPSTLEPPLYSVFLFLVQFFQRADILIHFSQILALFISSFFIYKIVRSFLGRNLSLAVISLFLLLPANIIFASSLMSESFALLFFSSFLYLSFRSINEKKSLYYSMLLVLSSIMVLQRYNFIVLYGVAFLLFIFLKHKKKTDYLYLLISLFIIFGWVLINHGLNGSWGLSNSVGKHLYDRIVFGDRLLPPESDLNLKELRKYTGEKVDLKRPEWEIEHYVYLYNNSETKTSELLGRVAVSALAGNPMTYILNTFKGFFYLHGNGLPFPEQLYTYGIWMGQGCRKLGTIQFCTPIIQSKLMINFWNNYLVPFSEFLTNNIPLILNYLLLFPSIVYAALQKNRFIRYCAVIYLLSVMVSLATEVPVFRYLYPLYPLQLILVVYFLSQTFPKFKRTKSA